MALKEIGNDWLSESFLDELKYLRLWQEVKPCEDTGFAVTWFVVTDTCFIYKLQLKKKTWEIIDSY